MLTRQEWEHLFSDSGPDWRERYRILEREIRAGLALLPPGSALDTTAFARHLNMDGLSPKADREAYRRLLTLARNVPGLAHSIPSPGVGPMRNKIVNRYYWSRSGAEAPPSPPPAAKAASKATLHDVLAQLETLRHSSDAIFSQLADLRQRVANLEVKQQ